MSVKPSIFSSDCRGFTLMEILIAIFILGVVLTTIYAAYSGTLRVIREIDDDTLAYKMARITLDRMNRDITSILKSGKVFVFQSEKTIINRREYSSLFMWSSGHLAFGEDELSGAPASIAYFVKEDKEGGISLRRSDVSGPNPSEEKKKEGGIIICRGLQSLKLKFYDESGKDYDTWDTSASTSPQKGRPPAVVQVDLMLDNPRDTEKPYKFMTKICLPVRK